MPITSSSSFADVSPKISQLIAKSWLPEGKKAKQILLGGNSEEIEKLFKKNEIDLNGLVEQSPVNIVIDTKTCNGNIEQIRNSDKTLTVKIPYPPQPGELSDDDLTQWVNDTSDNVYGDNIYSRICSC